MVLNLNKIRYLERNKTQGADTCYELIATQLPLEKTRQLETLVEQSRILECQSEHRGPAEGEHEISLVVETTEGTHESTACDVTLEPDQEDLALFVKKEGHCVETTTADEDK